MVYVQLWKQSMASSGALLHVNREINEMTSKILYCKDGSELMSSYMNSCVLP